MIQKQKLNKSLNAKKKLKTTQRKINNDLELIAIIVDENPKLKSKVLEKLTPKINIIQAQQKEKTKEAKKTG